MMRQQVTLRRRVGFTRDEIGDPTPLFTEVATTMYLEPVTGVEEGGLSSGMEQRNSGRHTPVGTWFGVGSREIEFDSWQEVVYGDHVLEISSPVRPMFNPRLGVVSHIEMDLVEIDQ